jgi:choline-sulfatase
MKNPRRNRARSCTFVGLLAPGLLALGLLVIAGCGLRGGTPHNVLLVIIDTLRADHLGCYGRQQAVTPNADRLAGEGIRFTDAVSHVPVTAPSITTILTGVHPPAHGVRDNGIFRLPESIPTLAEAFSAGGYRTAAFVSAAVIEGRYGLDRGFETYDDDVSRPYRYNRPNLQGRERLHQNVERRAADTTERVLDWLRENGDEPFFLVVHYFDPHDPYDPPPEFVRPPLETYYDAEIAYTDANLGRVLETLEWEDRLDETLVVLVSDHGEGGGDHGEVAHGFFVYDSTVHVPFIVRWPGLEGRGRTVDRQVRLVDVAPTLLDLCGLETEGFGEGRSLAPVLRGDGDLGPEPAYIENYRVRYSYGWKELVAIRTGEWKYIRAPRSELYDLKADPGELDNVIARRRDVAIDLSRRLDHLRLRLEPEEKPDAELALDAESERKLRALGYVTSGARDEPVEHLPDPKDEMAAYLRRQEAKDLIIRANVLLETGRTKDARSALGRALELTPNLPLTHYNMGLFYQSQDRPDSALGSFHRAVSLDPSYAPAWRALGHFQYGRGNEGEALEAFRAAQQAEPDTESRNDLFFAYLRTGRMEEALAFARGEAERTVEEGTEAGGEEAEGEGAEQREHDWPLHAEAFVHYAAGDYGLERERFETALPPDDPTARYRLAALEVERLAPGATAAMREEAYGRAVALLGPALAEHPQSVPLAATLGVALAEGGGDPGQAEELATRAVENAGGDPVIEGAARHARARVWLAAGRRWDAERELESAASLLQEVFEPYLARLLFDRGRAALAVGKEDQAAAFLSRALEAGAGEPWEGEARRGGGSRRMTRE